ncbi:hypothetical protein H6G97_39560 [Nostoc flagelliforme FACHB-838]|uniref:Uncharacterized protein n=1 Tax=Nostoc flagelliforme FACHB-838 TaxID=2692904 RepID=A0ABR8E3P8_9NOSO|nr:hypothetical protein [Nostoc flagelliforme]MBD2535185.1 hypothetical protein [Nostoc flagelliforme FACHB-838]
MAFLRLIDGKSVEFEPEESISFWQFYVSSVLNLWSEKIGILTHSTPKSLVSFLERKMMI